MKTIDYSNIFICFKAFINSASSGSSKATQSESKEPDSNTNTINKPKPVRTSRRKTAIDNQTKPAKISQPSINKTRKNCSNSLSNINSRFSQIETRIDSQLAQLKTGQNKYYFEDSSIAINEPPTRHNSVHNIQNLEKIQNFDSLFGERASNYNPSTLYRLKKLQDYSRIDNKKNLPTNLIATLDTNTDYNRVFDVPKKCACCGGSKFEAKSDFVRNQINGKSSSSECGCSDAELDTNSDTSTGECNVSGNVGRIPATRVAQRVKSVQLLQNKNIQFLNSIKSPMVAYKSSSSSQMPGFQPILKINKFCTSGSNNQQNLASLKQFSAAAATNRKLIENETRINQNRNLINRNTIELDESVGVGGNDNSFNSVHSGVSVQSPCVNNMKNSYILKKLGGTPLNPTFFARRQGLSTGKYPEAISVSGKSFLGNEAPSYSFSNKSIIVSICLRLFKSIK